VRPDRHSGRLLLEVLASLMIIAVLLVGVSGLERQGERLQRKSRLQEKVRRQLANTLARTRAQVRAGEPIPARRVTLNELDPLLEGTIEVATRREGKGLVRLTLTAKWRSGEHRGRLRREVLVRSQR